MIHPWIFGGSLLVGGGLMAFALTTQTPPRLPSLEPSPTTVRVLPPEPATVVVEPASTLIQMPEVRLVGHTKRIATAIAPEPEAQPAPLRPCSDWRELGPTQLVTGRANDIVSVRELCR